MGSVCTGQSWSYWAQYCAARIFSTAVHSESFRCRHSVSSSAVMLPCRILWLFLRDILIKYLQSFKLWQGPRYLRHQSPVNCPKFLRTQCTKVVSKLFVFFCVCLLCIHAGALYWGRNSEHSSRRKKYPVISCWVTLYFNLNQRILYEGGNLRRCHII